MWCTDLVSRNKWLDFGHDPEVETQTLVSPLSLSHNYETNTDRDFWLQGMRDAKID